MHETLMKVIKRATINRSDFIVISQTSILKSSLMSLHGLLVTFEMIFEVYNSESKIKYHVSLQHSREF